MSLSLIRKPFLAQSFAYQIATLMMNFRHATRELLQSSRTAAFSAPYSFQLQQKSYVLHDGKHHVVLNCPNQLPFALSSFSGTSR